MNFIRKKPPSSLDDLTALYNDVANKTIQNLALEDRCEFKRAILGWKGLHTHALYELDVINKSSGNTGNNSYHHYSSDELYVREGIENLLAKGVEHLERTWALYIESGMYEADERAGQAPQGGINIQGHSQQPQSNSYIVPTMRSGSLKSFAERQAESQPVKSRMLKTLRPEKPGKYSSSRSLRNAISRNAALTNSNNNNSNSNNSNNNTHERKPSNWTTSKSLGGSSGTPSPITRDVRHSQELNLFDESFDTEGFTGSEFLNNLQTIKRNETLSQLEATANSSKTSRSRSKQTGLESKFSALNVDDNQSRNSIQDFESDLDTNTASSELMNPFESFTSLNSTQKPIIRPPIPKTIPLLSVSPPKKPSSTATSGSTTPSTPGITTKKRPGVLSNSKSASTTRLPIKSTAQSHTTSQSSSLNPNSTNAALKSKSTPSLNKPTPYTNVPKPTIRTAAAAKTMHGTGVRNTSSSSVRKASDVALTAARKGTTTANPNNVKSAVRTGVKPTRTKQPVKTTTTNTARPTRPGVNNSLKPPTIARVRSESPRSNNSTVTKDTETISDVSSTTSTTSSNSGPSFVDEMELSEKEIEQKMQDQIIESIRGIDPQAAKQIFNEIVVKGDEVHWEDIAGLETAKNSLKETVVYPFLRPDLFSGLREPARGMLLFGPPGTGKTMLARAVATESKSTFFSISASSLTSKFLGESEKLVRALFLLARKLSPSIIFVDEIDSLLSARNEGGEHESSRRIKNEFLIQWSELTHAAAGRDRSNEDDGDLQRVLVLAATNLPWSIDEAARRRFVRRQYIPLPEFETRLSQFRKLLAHQKNEISEEELNELVQMTDGFSGSDITALAKDAAMGPLRQLGDKLLSTARDEIRAIEKRDFVDSMKYIRASVSKENLDKFDEWAKLYGSSGV